MTTIDLLPDSDAELETRVRALAERLERERARNAGLERGVVALSETVEGLRQENADLRRRLSRYER